MLRGNLSTRPFYNERLATMVIGAVAAVAVLLTGYNVWRLTVLSSERADVQAALSKTRQAIADVDANTVALRQSVDRPTLARLATSAREANGLIDQRTFSWTTLFGILEKELPFDVRLTAVTPRLERGTIHLGMNVIARDFANLDEFVEALGETGAFYDVVPTEQRRTEDGQYAALVEAAYLPPPMAPAAQPAAQPAAAPAAPAASAPAGAKP